MNANLDRVEALAEALISLGYVSDVTIQAIVGRPRVPAGTFDNHGAD